MEFRDKPMENLMRLQEKDICKNVNALLLEGEQIVGAYKTVRDQVVFTSHRIIMVDMQGVTGTRQLAFCAALPQGAALWHSDGGFWRSAAGVPADSLLCGRPRGQVWLYWAEGPVSGGKRYQRPHPVRKIMNRSRCTRVCAAAFFTHFCGWLYTKRMKI